MKRFLSTLQFIWKISVLFFLGVIFTVVLLQVFTRYVINIPLLWTDEISKIFFLWMVYFGVIMVFVDGTSIRLDLLTNYIPDKARLILEIVFNIIGLALSIFLLPYSMILVLQSFSFTLSITKLPWAYIYIVGPLLFVSIAGISIWWLLKHSIKFNQLIRRKG